MNKQTPNYYAIIPAFVRYDSDLIPNAKLLYGEISALCDKEGYCWAGNGYFSTLYGVDKRTITRWITSLIEKGYISSQLIKRENNQVEKRILKLEFPTTPIDKNVLPYRQNCQDPIDKNVLYNNTSINTTNNTTSINNPPISPTRGKGGLQENRFNQFWETYPRKIGKNTALKAWNKIKPNEELFNQIIDSIENWKQSEQWQRNNGQYIPHPTTWLNRGGWEDEITTEDVKGNGKVTAMDIFNSPVWDD